MTAAAQTARRRYRERHPERDKQARLGAKARWIARNPEKYSASNRRRAAAFRQKHPEKVKAGLKRWYAANRDRVRDYQLRSNFGISLVEWKAMFAKQGRACACCGSFESNTKKGWQTDHCHLSGEIRGILCGPCNYVLTEHLTLERLDQIRRYLTKPVEE